MNTDKFRYDLKTRLEETARSVLDVARECDVEQASLSRFLAGEQKGLNASTVFALWSFVYAEQPTLKRATPCTPD